MNYIELSNAVDVRHDQERVRASRPPTEACPRFSVNSGTLSESNMSMSGDNFGRYGEDDHDILGRIAVENIWSFPF